MRQRNKGNQWYFGIKRHFGVDSGTKFIHAVLVTATNTADGSVVGDLLNSEEARVWRGKAYDGQGEAISTPAAQNHSDDKVHRHRPLREVQEATNRYKSSVCSKGERPIGTIKRVFGVRNVRYRGIEKNASRLLVGSGLANLFMVRRLLMRAAG